MPFKAMPAHIKAAPASSFPLPAIHTGRSYDPYTAYTARWTRADARQIMKMNNPNVATGVNSLPTRLTMPAIPLGFPVISNSVWVWDTWPLTDAKGNQYSYNGWDIIFCLTAKQNQGYGFDDRHVHARIGFFYRRHGGSPGLRPAAGGWIYGGNVFPDGASASVYKGQPFTQQAEWSGSARLLKTGGNQVQVFYTDLAFNRDANANNITPPQATITTTMGQIHADYTHVWFTGMDNHIPLLQPDGYYYQTGQQNQFFSFRDPYTFVDPANPGKTFMVFEGNSAGIRGQTPCDQYDLGYRPNDPNAETVAAVNASGAIYQRANIGLAVATSSDMTRWKFLPPLVSGNCVNDQTERPSMHIIDGKYYLLTISHRSTFAAGIDGPDGQYGWVGKGIRSDWVPLNESSGLMMGNPTDLNTAAGADYALNPDQNPNAYQSYSHYLMPNGLVTSFIDTVGDRRGGTEAPTVQITFKNGETYVNDSYGTDGLGGYGDITPNKQDIDFNDFTEMVAAKTANTSALMKGLSATSLANSASSDQDMIKFLKGE